MVTMKAKRKSNKNPKVVKRTKGFAARWSSLRSAQITTTGLAGGLFWPYKGPLPALESKDSSKGSPAATSCT